VQYCTHVSLCGRLFHFTCPVQPSSSLLLYSITIRWHHLLDGRHKGDNNHTKSMTKPVIPPHSHLISFRTLDAHHVHKRGRQSEMFDTDLPSPCPKRSHHTWWHIRRQGSSTCVRMQLHISITRRMHSAPSTTVPALDFHKEHFPLSRVI
jgi:hypothetical protein